MKSLNAYFKRWFKTQAFRVMICHAIALYIRVVFATNRKIIVTHPDALPYMRGEHPAIFAFWHGRLLMVPMIRPRNRAMHAMVSNHRDGEVIAKTLLNLGVQTIRGSSSRGGATAAMQAISALRNGDNVVVTPDGPRGPIYKVQPGVLYLSDTVNVPIIPVTYRASRHKLMKSWDRFMLALPFGTLHYAVGAPLWHATGQTLENEMTTLLAQVEHAPC